MRPDQFCYWLQGFFEVSEAQELTPRQTEQIKKHLSLVFAHVLDKGHGDEQEQKKLNEIHSPKSPTPTTASSGANPQKPGVGGPYMPPKFRC